MSGDGFLEGNSVRVLQGLLDSIRPKSLLTVSQWAEAERVLPPATNEPGAWRNSRTPYLQEIMDCMSEGSPVQEVTLMAGAQIGKSEACLNCLGYWIDVAPANMILGYPTEDLARIMSKQRVRTLIDYTPAVARRVHEAGGRNEKNTMLQKEFNGGMLIIVSMQSAASLRAIAARYLLRDEMDAAPINLPGEGDPTVLLENRQNTYGFTKKTINTGTPLVEDSSRLHAKLKASDWRRYYVPCPGCDHMQTLDWDIVHWEQGKPETAGFVCRECGEKFYDSDKDDILARGEWRPTQPENADPKTRGYQISSLYSPYGWNALEKIVRRWLDSKLDLGVKQVWQNTDMGLPYRLDYYRPDHAKWRECRQKLKKGADCSSEVMVITAGVDTQWDRVEIYVYGWAKGEVFHAIDYHWIQGDLSEREWWHKDVFARLRKKYRTEDGRELPIACAATDTGGNWTSEVYRHVDACNHAKPIPRPMDIAIKGSSNYEAPIITQRPSEFMRKDLSRKVKLWKVGTNKAKQTIYDKINKLQARIPHKWANGDKIDDEYFKQVTSEKLEKKITPSGKVDYIWHRISGVRNEALDCLVYAYAALKHLHVDWRDLIKSENARGKGKVAVPEVPVSPVEAKGRVVRTYRSPAARAARRGVRPGRGRVDDD